MSAAPDPQFEMDALNEAIADLDERIAEKRAAADLLERSAAAKRDQRNALRKQIADAAKAEAGQ